MDKIKFLKISALLSGLKLNLPVGDVELNHVEDFHSLLTELQEQVGTDLSEFRIPPSAIKTRAIPLTVSYVFGQPQSEPYEYQPYCDEKVFKKQVDAVLIFVEAIVP